MENSRIKLKVNGFIISIIQGPTAYSGMEDTVEVGVWYDRDENHPTGEPYGWFHPEPDMDDNVLGYVDAKRLAHIIQTIANHKHEETS